MRLRATSRLALVTLLAGLASPMAPWGALAAEPAATDPPQVFFPGRACASRVLEVEIWDPTAGAGAGGTAAGSWKPHPQHPRVVANSCQSEAASQSLSEIRIRCVDPAGRADASPWRVGLGMDWRAGGGRCADREHDPDGAGVSISSPRPGTLVTNEENYAGIAGRVGFGEREVVGYEILIAIDTSGSTQQPAGVDVDNDGEVGVPFERGRAIFSTDPGDSILAAEVKAVRMLVDRLEPGLGPTRVGLVTFSGEYIGGEGVPTRRSGIRVETPLSDDFYELGAVLDQILTQGSGGSTDFFAAVDRSLLELSGRWDAVSDARPGARKVVLLLTDGLATPRPAGAPKRAGTLLATREADHVAIHIYALGGLADEFPSFVRALLQDSAGSFTRVSDPSQATSFLDDLALAEVRNVEIQNLTLQQAAESVSLSPDGRFSGQLPVRSGRNVVLVTAHAADGRERRAEFELRYVNPLEQQRLLEEERNRQSAERLRKQLEIRPEEQAPSP